jgi:hypothetical protein
VTGDDVNGETYRNIGSCPVEVVPEKRLKYRPEWLPCPLLVTLLALLLRIKVETYGICGKREGPLEGALAMQAGQTARSAYND